MAFCVFTINKITMRVNVFANIVNYNVIYSSVFSNTNYEYLGKKKFLLPETFPLIFFFIKVNIYILPWNYFITAGHCWSPRPLNHLYARSVGRFAHSLQSSSSLIESELTVLITWRPNRNKSYLLLFTPRCTPVELCAFCQRATSWSFFFFWSAHRWLELDGRSPAPQRRVCPNQLMVRQRFRWPPPGCFFHGHLGH